MGPHKDKIKMGRQLTGKEGTNFWQERYGQKAGMAPMVSRVVTRSDFSEQGSYGFPVNNSGVMLGNNMLIHSIRCINTLAGSDHDSVSTHFQQSLMYIYDNSISSSDNTAASLKLQFMVNDTRRKNSTVTFVFPIPILLVNGGRVRRSTSQDGPIINICYTLLESIGEIDHHKDTFLQSYYTAGDVSETVVDDSDVEVYGVFLNTTATTQSAGDGSYAAVRIKNGAGSTRAEVHISEMWTKSIGDEELDSSDPPIWFPYPVYLKDGFIQAATGDEDGKDDLHSTVFYRKVNAASVNHGWT